MEKEGKNITISDVAEALGVSKTTVSRAISGKGRIGDATRQRVLAYIEEYDYKPNVIAKGLAQSKTFNLCVVMPEDYNLADLPFFHQAIIGIQEAASQMEYDILLCIGKERDSESLERILMNRKVDGVILLRTYIRDIHVELLQNRQIPFVTVGTTDYPDVYQVDHDQRNACRELTGLLLSQKTDRVALLGGMDSLVVTRERLRGFEDACRQAGIEPEPELIRLNLENRESVEMAAEDVMKKQAECILCMDDVICSHVLQKIRQEHKKIPQDIRLASFYNSSVLENSVPSITSLVFNARELGGKACQTLLERIEGKEVPKRILLPYEIALKESTKKGQILA